MLFFLSFDDLQPGGGIVDGDARRLGVSGYGPDRRRLLPRTLGSVGVIGIAFGGPFWGRAAACLAKASVTIGSDDARSSVRRLARE